MKGAERKPKGRADAQLVVPGHSEEVAIARVDGNQTLTPWEKDKPTINRHFLGRPRFRMKPKRLVCSGLARGRGEGRR